MKKKNKQLRALIIIVIFFIVLTSLFIYQVLSLGGFTIENVMYVFGYNAGIYFLLFLFFGILLAVMSSNKNKNISSKNIKNEKN